VAVHTATLLMVLAVQVPLEYYISFNKISV
jgi:hypothetical protein